MRGQGAMTGTHACRLAIDNGVLIATEVTTCNNYEYAVNVVEDDDECKWW